MKKILFIIVLLINSSCAPNNSNYNIYDDFRKSLPDYPTKKRDDYKKITKYESSNIYDGGLSFHLIRSWKHDNGTINHQLYINLDYENENWIFWDHAYDSNGNKLETSIIDRAVKSCSSYTGICFYNEILGVALSAQHINKLYNNKSPLSIKLYSKAGIEKYINIPYSVIKDHLDNIKGIYNINSPKIIVKCHVAGHVHELKKERCEELNGTIIEK
jgi:hypothetical protein